MSEIDVAGLSRALCEADADATQKCAQIKGKGVVILMGCTGSGKTTVSVYSQGTDFELVHGSIQEKVPVTGSEIGGRMASITRGMVVGNKPISHDLLVVDLAGTGDTAGSVADLCGAIYRSSVLQAACSVRVVLVVGLDRLHVCNERGKGFIRDLDHAAGLFKRMSHNLESVGMVVTSDPSVLMQMAAVASILERTKSACESLAEHAKPEAADHTSLRMSGTEITPEGLELLQHLCKHCRHACAMLDQVPEADDAAILKRLCGECAIYPVNVLREDQRGFLRRFLFHLQPVMDPSVSMAYRLPSECKNEVTTALDSESARTMRMLNSTAADWAKDSQLVDRVFSLLHLVNLREVQHLLPWIQSLQQDLSVMLLTFNKKATADLMEAVVYGNMPKLECALQALSAMDAFRKELSTRIPDLMLADWSSLCAAMLQGVSRASEELTRVLPADLADIKWDESLANLVCTIFRAVEKLGDAGSALLKGWASKLLQHISGLKSQAAESVDAGRVVRALLCLEEMREHLPELVELLSGYGCQQLAGGGLVAFTEEAKAAVRAQLSALSRRLVEEKRVSQEAGTSDLLKQLCRSTELNRLLGDDLVDTFIMKPLSSVLIPTQEEVDVLCKLMLHSPPPDQWCTHLSRISQRLHAAGDLSMDMVRVADLHFEALLGLVEQEVAAAKAVVQTAVRQLSSSPQLQQSIARRSLSALSDFSGNGAEDDELPGMQDLQEDAEVALMRLRFLLPADSLLCLFDRADTDTAAMALQSLAWTLSIAELSLLKKAQKARGKMSWLASANLDAAVLSAALRLKALLPLASATLEGLRDPSVRDPESLSGVCRSLNERTSSSNLFLQELVQKELDEWASASAGPRGWLEHFYRHIEQVDQLQRLMPDEVGQAAQKLMKKVTDWQEECLSKACQASEQEQGWPDFIELAVRQGMQFEDSALFHRLSFHREDFRLLVEVQAEKWQKEAAVGPSRGKRVVGQKLRNLMTAIESLQGFARKDTRTLELYAGLAAALRPLDAAVNDDESRFLQALQEERYHDACELLAQVPDSKHCDLLKEHMGRALEQAFDLLGRDAEDEELVRAAKRARTLIRSLERLRFPDTEVMAHFQERLELAKADLARRTNEADQHLQRALEGRGMPSRALVIFAALSGKSRITAAEEVFQTFSSMKREAFSSMSCVDLIAWITQQDSARRSMPEELRSNTAAYDGLIKDFVSSFVKAFKTDVDLLQDYHGRREWGQVKQMYEQLRDIIESALDLDVLKAEKAQLRSLKRRLGMGGEGTLAAAKEDITRGSFFLAIRALIMSDGGDGERQLCEAIHSELARNMHAPGTDEASLDRRLSTMEAFLAEVGEHPPDELKSLCSEVSDVCGRLKPQLEAAALRAVEEGLHAATAAEVDLCRLARALVLFRSFESAVGATKRQELHGAVTEFQGRVRRAVERAGEDVRNLDLSSLALSLEPLRLWLQSYDKLSQEERQLLMAHLQSEHVELKGWMRELLAVPLEGLLDGSMVQREADAMNFGSISRRCKTAERLHVLLATARVDLAPLEEQVERHRDAALRALQHASSLEEFNPHYKALKSISSDLPEMSIASRLLAELQNAFTTQILDAPTQQLRKAKTIQEALQASVDLRSVANAAPDTYEEVMSRVKSGLASLQQSQSFSTRGINALGGQLGQNPVGQLIIAEHPEVFGTAKDMQNNALFRRAGETCCLEEVVGRLTRVTGLGHHENCELRKALQEHEQLFAHLKTRYLLQNKPIETVMMEAKQALQVAVQACSPERPESSRALLTHLAVCYSIVKCGSDFMEAPTAEQQEHFVAPHRAQMLTIFRLLHAHTTGPASFWSWLPSSMSSWVTGACGQRRKRAPANHLAQVLTGEGKCLTLGLLASFLALKGVGSDIVCYRKILTEQDRYAMLPFYKFVEVEDKIRYVTFDELCSERLEVIRDASKELVDTGRTSQTAQQRDVSGRALLIDEVDVFFGRRFYGQTWDGGFKLNTPEAEALVRFVFEEARSGRPVKNILAAGELKRLLDKSPAQMREVLKGIAMALARNIEEWTKPEPILDEGTGRIGYKEGDDVNYDLSYANKTVFAYLSFELESRIAAAQAKEHIGLDIFCGRFSFAELPKEYCCILGVTGTLQQLLDIPGIKLMLEQEYGFRHFTYTPSIFGAQRLTFKEAEHVVVLDNEADWLSSIESHVQDQKKFGNSVLVFFKNEAELQKYPGWSDMENLTERTDPRRRSGYISAATAKGRATLLTRAYGRGIDFQMPEDHAVVVVQTFLSSLVSEQTQIKGRTARQGKPGQYRLVLCAEHLEAKVGFNPAEVQTLKSGTGEQIRRLLSEKQMAKTQSKVACMRQRKEKAALLERETEAWEGLLFDPDKPADIKLAKLAEWNGNSVFREVHYTVLLDRSISMTGGKWDQLTVAFGKFRQELMRDPVVAAITSVSVVLFNHLAHTVTPAHAKAAEVQEIGHHQTSGGTSFAAAFGECHRVMGHSSPNAQEVLLFLTDGAAAVPEQEIGALLADHKSRIKSLTSIAFGRDAAVQTLQRIGHLFSNEGVAFKLTAPDDEASLVQTFVEAAGNRAIHFGQAS